MRITSIYYKQNIQLVLSDAQLSNVYDLVKIGLGHQPAETTVGRYLCRQFCKPMKLRNFLFQHHLSDVTPTRKWQPPKNK